MKRLLLLMGIFSSVNSMDIDDDYLKYANLPREKCIKILSKPPTDESIQKYEDHLNFKIEIFKYEFTKNVEEKQVLIDEVINSVKERDIKKRHDRLAIILKKVYEYGMDPKNSNSYSLWGMTSCALDTLNEYGLFVNAQDPRIALFVEEIDMVTSLYEPLDYYHPVLSPGYGRKEPSIFERISRFFRKLFWYASHD